MATNVEKVRIMDFRGTYKGGGGPDKTILFSAAAHDSEQFYVLVTYLRDPEDQEFDIHRKAAALGINYVDVPDRSLIDWHCLSLLHGLIQKHGITLLHSHDDKTLLYGWLLKLRRPSLVIMHTCHSQSCYERSDFDAFVGYAAFLLREKTRSLLMNRYAKPILTISENTKNRLVKNGVKAEEIEVLYNGIQVKQWQADDGVPVLREELALADDMFLVGTVARITYDKDLPTFYETARRVSEEINNVIFVIVGDGHGDDLEKSKAEVKSLGLSHVVHFLGHRNDLLDIYKSFDVFLMTSLTEGLPNTVLEAMAMEVPVVSTEVGGVGELVLEGATGFLCEIGDAAMLAKKIISLSENKVLRGQFSVAAKKRVADHFSFEHRVNQMERFYLRFAGR